APPAAGMVQNTSSLASAFPTAAQILVSSIPAPGVVKIQGLIVDGAGNGMSATGCGLDLIGIYFQNAGGTVTETTLRNQTLEDSNLLGCQDGEALFVENLATGPTTPSTLTITKNDVSAFQKNGITLHGAVAAANIKNNVVTGIGPTEAIAQNGIELAYGST